jgi:hypothetical protein
MVGRKQKQNNPPFRRLFRQSSKTREVYYFNPGGRLQERVGKKHRVFTRRACSPGKARRLNSLLRRLFEIPIATQ